MLILLSPAKTQQTEQSRITDRRAAPFIKKAQLLIDELRDLNDEAIAKLMKIKPHLAEKTVEQFRTWGTEESIDALSAYAGPAFKALNPQTLSDMAVKRSKNSLIILSGLYGALHSDSEISPYRFEMGLSYKPQGEISLYSFWKKDITSYLESLCNSEKHRLIVDISSKEYSKVIDFKSITTPKIVIEFREFRDGKLKSISSYAKQARGSMARWILENDPQSMGDLKQFTEDGYCYSPENSTNETLFFVRKS